MGEDFEDCLNNTDGFNIPDTVLEEIQKNIEEIINNFPVPEDNKLDVLKKINFMYNSSRYLSQVDSLTGLYNRRNFDSNLEREFIRAKRYKSELCIAIIDIDFFKKINDSYGHLCGDFILKEVAYLISENFRKTDMVFRFGGEEFVVILPETPISQVSIPLERLRQTVEQNNFSYNGNKLKVTISIGAALNNAETTEEFLDNADKALYEAKNNGRNRLVISKVSD